MWVLFHTEKKPEQTPSEPSENIESAYWLDVTGAGAIKQNEKRTVFLITQRISLNSISG